MAAATTRRGSRESTVGTPESAPVGTPTMQGSHDHSFTLQAIMELQRSVSQLQATVVALQVSVEATKSSAAETKAKVTHLEKLAYAAGVVILIFVGAGGWTLSVAKDFAMTYFKASVEHRVSDAPPTPPLKETAPPARSSR